MESDQLVIMGLSFVLLRIAEYLIFHLFESKLYM